MSEFIYRPDGDTDLSNAVIVNETTLPQTISGLAAGNYQAGRVTWAGSTVTVRGAPTAPTKMSAPIVTSAGASSVGVDLAAAPNDGGSTITSYDLRYSTDRTNWTVVSDVSDPEIVSGLTADTLYYIQTRAVNAVDGDPDNWSAFGNVTTDAASDILWDDQFLASQPPPMPSYNIGDSLTEDTSGAYSRAGGFQHVKVYDIGGVRAVQIDPAETRSETVLYDTSTVSDDRIVTFVIAQMASSATANNLYCHYINSENYISANVQAGGNWRARVKVGGENVVNSLITSSDLSAGSKISIENDTAAETVSFKVNGVHVAGSPFSVSGGVTGLGKPGFILYGNTAETNNIALSRFAIEET